VTRRWSWEGCGADASSVFDGWPMKRTARCWGERPGQPVEGLSAYRPAPQQGRQHAATRLVLRRAAPHSAGLPPTRAVQAHKATAAQWGSELVRLQQGTAFSRSCEAASRVPAESAGGSALPRGVLHAGRPEGRCPPRPPAGHSKRALRCRGDAQCPRAHPEPALQGPPALTPAPRAPGAGTRRTHTAAAGKTTWSTRRDGIGSSRGASRAWGEPAPGRPPAARRAASGRLLGVCGRLGVVGSVSHAGEEAAAGASADLPPAPFVLGRKRLGFRVSQQWKPWEISAEVVRAARPGQRRPRAFWRRPSPRARADSAPLSGAQA